jgi:uncharacterized membrane protein YgaE (UPF0421/DUF939 family)
MTFGARTFKTGLSIVLAIYVAQLFHYTNYMYAGVAASLTIMPTLYRSWKYLIAQMKGNLIGASIAVLAFLLVDKVEPWMIGIVVIVAISINIRLGFEKSIGLVVLTIIAILGAPQGSEITIAFNRISLVLIGFFSSLFINTLFVPPKHENKLQECIIDVNKTIISNLKLLMMGASENKVYKEERGKLQNSIEKTKEIYLLYKEEFESKIKKQKYKNTRNLALCRHFCNSYDKLFSLIGVMEKHYFQKRNQFSEALNSKIDNHFYLIMDNIERINLKIEKKVIIPEKHQRDLVLFDSSDEVINLFVEFLKDSKNIEDQKTYLLHLLSAFAEVVSELDTLERLIDSLNAKHVEK